MRRERTPNKARKSKRHDSGAQRQRAGGRPFATLGAKGAESCRARQSFEERLAMKRR